MASVFLRYYEVFRYFESFYLVKWPKNSKFYSSNARVYAISGFAIAGVHCTLNSVSSKQVSTILKGFACSKSISGFCRGCDDAT